MGRVASILNCKPLTVKAINFAVVFTISLAHGKIKWHSIRYMVPGSISFCLPENDTSDNTHALWGMSRDGYAQYLMNNGKYKVRTSPASRNSLM